MLQLFTIKPAYMQKDLMEREAQDKLKELIEEINVCMFISDTELGQTSRPMATIKVDEDLGLWFITDKNSLKIQDILKDDMVHLIYAHPGQEIYLDVWGHAAIILDHQKIKKLWSPVVKAWFPKGIEDSNLCLLHVFPNSAHYWDSKSSKMVTFFNIMTAGITGKASSRGDEGELYF